MASSSSSGTPAAGDPSDTPRPSAVERARAKRPCSTQGDRPLLSPFVQLLEQLAANEREVLREAWRRLDHGGRERALALLCERGVADFH